MAPKKKTNQGAEIRKPFALSLKGSTDPKVKKMTGRKGYQTLMDLHRKDMESKKHEDFREASFRLVEVYRPHIRARLSEVDAELTLVLMTGVHKHWNEAGDCFIEAMAKLIELFGVSLARGGDLVQLASRAYQCKKLRSNLLLTRPYWETLHAPGSKDWHTKCHQMMAENSFFFVEKCIVRMGAARDNSQYHIVFCWQQGDQWMCWDEVEGESYKNEPYRMVYASKPIDIGMRWPRQLKKRCVFYFPGDRLKNIIKLSAK